MLEIRQQSVLSETQETNEVICAIASDYCLVLQSTMQGGGTQAAPDCLLEFGRLNWESGETNVVGFHWTEYKGREGGRERGREGKKEERERENKFWRFTKNY